MVQKYHSPIRVYKYPFELVMMAYERRFPSCPLIPVVADCEIMTNVESADGSQRITERRCKLHVDAPYLLKKLINVDFVYFIQKNTLDRRMRNLNIECHNESFATRLIVLENCRYYVHPENADWTCFEQSASLEIRAFFGFENTMEKLSMKQYSANIAKGKEIIEHFVIVLAEEGVTSVEVWDETNAVTITNIDSAAITASDEFPLGASASHEAQPTDLELGCQFQLETDYIQRYLGQLSPMQESKLVLLRSWVANLQKGKVPSDGTLLRFLRARDFHVEKARELLSQSLIWRKKHQVDKILSEYNMSPVVKDYFPGGWHHHDKDGRPLYLLRLGQMDVKGLLKATGEEGLLQLTLHICEEGLQLMEEATRSSGQPISTWCLLVDLEGLNMRHLWRPGIQALLRIIEIVEANYPETMGRVLIIRAPRVFPILWTLVSTFIDENTRTKFLFYGGNDYQEPGGLVDYIPQDFIPDFLGGECRTLVQEGGLVPKSLYMTESEMEKERCPLTTVNEDTVYKSVSLGRGHVHEVLVTSHDPGSVITWDFDVMRQDVSYAVFRTHQPLGAKQPSAVLNPAEQRSIIDKCWTEGQDYFRVEQPVVCHDGESIQGSHVTAHVGTYILQWRNNETDLIDTFTSSKAQVMYHYDQLTSSDYRGSMSSLQSGNSGFSALSTPSVASSCPSR